MTSQGLALVALSIYDESVLDPIAALVADMLCQSGRISAPRMQTKDTLEYPSRPNARVVC